MYRQTLHKKVIILGHKIFLIVANTMGTDKFQIYHGAAIVDAAPKLCAHHCDAALIHEAAIGKIAGEQILKLRTLGLSEQEAEAKLSKAF